MDLHWDYDDINDVLYLSVGEPTPCLAEEHDDIEGLHIRRDLVTGEIVGATVLYLSRQDRVELEKALVAVCGDNVHYVLARFKEAGNIE